MTSWEQHISEEKKESKKEYSSRKRKAAQKIIDDLAKEKKAENKKKGESEYTSYLKQQLEFKKKKYEDQKKKELEKIKARGKGKSEAEKEKAKRALANIKTTPISSKDREATAYSKAIENIGSTAFGLAKAAHHGLASRAEKKKAADEERLAKERQKQKKAPGKPGRPKTAEVKTERKSSEKTSETRSLSGAPEAKRLVPSTKRLAPASKKIAPKGGTPYQAPPEPRRETGMSLGQRARRNPALKSALIKTRMEEYSNWREEFIFEVEDKKSKKKDDVIDIMKGKNKITMNPTVSEDHKEVASGKRKDDEGYMAMVEFESMERAIKALRKKIKKSDYQLPAWVQSKITRAADYINTASEYIQSNVSEELLDEAPLRDEPLWDMPGDSKNKPVRPNVPTRPGSFQSQMAKSNEIIRSGRVAAFNPKSDTVQSTQLANRRMPGNEKPGMSGPPTPGTSTATTKVTPARPGTSSPANATTAQKIQGGLQTYKAQVKSGDIKGAEATGKSTWALANPKLAAAQAERDRTRGTSASTNPQMAGLKDRLPAPKALSPTTASTSFSKSTPSLGTSSSAVQSAGSSAASKPTTNQTTTAFSSPALSRTPSKKINASIEYPEIADLLSEIRGGLWEAKKSEMPCNKPKAQAHGSGESGKSHVVKACEDGKEKLIRFGQLGVKGSPKKEGESEEYASRRHRFQTRHAKNIAKGKMSAAYWANKVKW